MRYGLLIAGLMAVAAPAHAEPRLTYVTMVLQAFAAKVECPGIDVAYHEAAEPRFDADRQPIAVLVVEHLVRLRRADTHDQQGEERDKSLAPKPPQHTVPPKFGMSLPRDDP